MKITLTVQDILDKYNWQTFCDIKNINEYAVNEGQLETDEEFTFTPEEAKQLGVKL